MKIIDFKKKGNVVRFYLGTDECMDYWGDDWDDAPYEHNAGTVYARFEKGHRDIAFPFDSLVLEPCDGECNSPYSKEDMKNRYTPCIIVVPKELAETTWKDGYRDWVGCVGIQRFCFEDSMEQEG